MSLYRCSVCGYVYDPERGDPARGVPPRTKFEDLQEDWVCPVCGFGKDRFSPWKPGKTGEDRRRPEKTGEDLRRPDLPKCSWMAVARATRGAPSPMVINSVEGGRNGPF